jgi:Flp pilus assembly protein TadG
MTGIVIGKLKWKRMGGLRDKQQGLAIVEFALVLPFMLLWLFAIAELGRAFYEYNTLAKAVGAGASYYARVQDIAVTQQLVIANAGALPASSPLTTAMITPVDNGTSVTVSVSYGFTPLTGDPLTGIMGLFGATPIFPLTMSASAGMDKL